MAMDIKVLAAVFITLFGIAMGMAQGDIKVDDFSDLAKLADRFKGIGTISDGGGFDLPSSSKTPNTTITASFSGDTKYRILRFSRPVDTVRVEGATVQLQVAGLTTSLDSVAMELHNYTGRLGLDGNVTIDGDVNSIEIDALPFNTSKPQTVKAVVRDPTSVHVDRLERTNLAFSGVDGTITTSAITIHLEKNDTQPAVFQSFTGTLDRNFTAGTYELDGKVFKAGKKGTKAMVGGN